jgi:hypothetical protein
MKYDGRQAASTHEIKKRGDCNLFSRQARALLK